jgi:hypothetical protein
MQKKFSMMKSRIVGKNDVQIVRPKEGAIAANVGPRLKAFAIFVVHKHAGINAT